jgi:hypothetical protein
MPVPEWYLLNYALAPLYGADQNDLSKNNILQISIIDNCPNNY